ncbi:hypothetical protein BDQ17DRAFT_1546997 [Cyathus striatus]|nr:hypothetical protein BDQ17DRAFT_1546997 [Cyathus striatus]
MKLYLFLILAYSLLVSLVFASPLDVTPNDLIEMRGLSPAEVHLVSLYRRRRYGGGSGVGFMDGMLNVIDGIKNMQGDDNKRREEFVKAALGKYGQQHPGYNIIVVHTDVGYDKDFGKDWGHAHEEVPIKIGGGSKGYDIFWFKKGTFNRHGDGGWLNWDIPEARREMVED